MAGPAADEPADRTEQLLGDCYQALPKPQPPAVIDERLVAAAREAVGTSQRAVPAQRKLRPAWSMRPLALAATVVLCLSFALHFQPDGLGLKLGVDPESPVSTPQSQAERAEPAAASPLADRLQQSVPLGPGSDQLDSPVAGAVSADLDLIRGGAKEGGTVSSAAQLSPASDFAAGIRQVPAEPSARASTPGAHSSEPSAVGALRSSTAVQPATETRDWEQALRTLAALLETGTVDQARAHWTQMLEQSPPAPVRERIGALFRQHDRELPIELGGTTRSPTRPQ